MLQKEIVNIKDNLFSKYSTNRYQQEIQLFEALRPFVGLKTQKVLDTLCEFHRYKGILEVLHEEKSQTTVAQLKENFD